MPDQRCATALIATWLLCSLLSTSRTLAEPSADQVDARESTMPSWSQFIKGIEALPEQMLAKLSPAQGNDPLIREEVTRLALAALTSSALDTLGSDPLHPVFLPSIGQILSVGQPNADTVYRVARIHPEGIYRLRGKRGSLALFNLSESPPKPGEPGFEPALMRQPGARPRHDFAELSVDHDDRFDVVLSQQRPAGYNGDWWPLAPTTHNLLLRMVSADWDKERAPTISIERLDTPVRRSRASAAELAERMRRLPQSSAFIGGLLIDRVNQMRARGLVNQLQPVDMAGLGGLRRQHFFEGAYDITEEEALIIETPVPATCGYYSLLLTNPLYETTDWYNNQSSLNHTQSEIDDDGVLRIVVSGRDPGVLNWLDTAGYPTGSIQGRWESCDSQPTPTVTRVRLSALEQQLPPDTPRMSSKEREQRIRHRRQQLQQRPLW